MIAAALLACAINVAPVTLEAVVRVESGGNPLALNVNRLQGAQPHPATLAEAVSLAQSYIAQGYSVDIGLMQVNNRNLAALGYTVEQVLDPCTNIRAGGTILAADYGRATQQLGVAPGQPALLAALSAYNTGDFARGFQNGYVARYVSLPQPTAPVIKVTSGSPVRRPPANPYAADTEVRWENALVVSRE